MKESTFVCDYYDPCVLSLGVSPSGIFVLTKQNTVPQSAARDQTVISIYIYKHIQCFRQMKI